jgi:hypothetical protein
MSTSVLYNKCSSDFNSSTGNLSLSRYSKSEKIDFDNYKHERHHLDMTGPYQGGTLVGLSSSGFLCCC